MGGGNSGLFFGTVGSTQEYQYSLFPDSIRKDSEYISKSSSTVVKEQVCLKKQLITSIMVLQKCCEYHDGSISARQLIDWLSYIVTSPQYKMKRSLRLTINAALNRLSYYIRLEKDSISSFNQELLEFENKLKRLT